MAIIKQIDIGGQRYDLYDATAIHDLSDIESLGLEGAFIYKGTVATVNDLPKTGMKTGYVYHVTENGSEYVYTTEGTWEEFGHHMVVDHKHYVTAAGTNTASAVTGTADVAGTNEASEVSASGSISVPTVTTTAKYAKITTTPAGTDTFVKSYPGATQKLGLTSVTPAGSATSVISSVSAPTGSVLGVSGSTTASKATAGTAVTVAKAGTAVTVATRAASQTTVATGLTGGSVTAGSVTKYAVTDTDCPYHASVAEGVLTLTPVTAVKSVTTTAVTLPTASTTQIYGCGDNTTVTPAVSNGSITPYTFADVTVPKAAETATTVVTGVSTDSKDVATVGTAVTVATGSLTSSGNGASVLTGLGTAVTASAATSGLATATLAAGTSSDLYVGDDVTVGSEDKTVSVSGTAAAQKWTQTKGDVTGTAAAQKFTGSQVTSGEAIATE